MDSESERARYPRVLDELERTTGLPAPERPEAEDPAASDDAPVADDRPGG